MEQTELQDFLAILVQVFLAIQVLAGQVVIQDFLVVAVLVVLVVLLRAWFMINLLQLHHKQHLQLL